MDKHIENGFQLLDDSQRPAYLLGIVQNWLIMVLDFVTMVIAAMLSSLAVTLRSSTGFTGASLVTLMSFGDQLTQIVIFLTLLETSLGKSYSVRVDRPPLTNDRCNHKATRFWCQCDFRGKDFGGSQTTRRLATTCESRTYQCFRKLQVVILDSAFKGPC